MLDRDLAENYIIDTIGITLPFMFGYETHSIINMCYLKQLQKVPATLLVLVENMASFLPCITNSQPNLEGNASFQ